MKGGRGCLVFSEKIAAKQTKACLYVRACDASLSSYSSGLVWLLVWELAFCFPTS